MRGAPRGDALDAILGSFGQVMRGLPGARGKEPTALDLLETSYRAPRGAGKDDWREVQYD